MILKPQLVEFCHSSLRSKYVDGPGPGKRPLGEARCLLQGTVSVLVEALKASGSPALVDIEKGGKLGEGVVKSLIIWTGKSTTAIKMTVTPAIVRIGKKPIYLLHGEGAVEVFNAIVAELDAALLDESDLSPATSIAGE